MKLLVLLPLLAIATLWAEDVPTDPAPPLPEANVNSKYKVESVQWSGTLNKRVSKSLREEAERLIGQNFDPAAVADLAQRVRKQVHLVVTHRVEKGLQPEHVRVIYETRERQWYEEDAEVTKLAYHQKQGWTGGVEAGFDVHGTRLEFGVQSDADRLLERFAGINVGVARDIVPERLRMRFEFGTFHQQWNGATLAALEDNPEVPGIYRERYYMDPEVVILLAPNLTLSTGLSFQHFQTQFPAARYEAANAVTTTLRHRRRWGSSGSTAGHELDAGYSLRAATNLLDSDFVYARHLADARYAFKHDRSTLTLRAMAGAISGDAPLFERFALGDTRTLRGWNKFDLDPLGGSRVAHGSIQYRYRCIGVFYDVGSVWDRNEDAQVKHSTGVLIALGRGGPFLTVGIPLREGNVYPLFMMGMNF